MLFTPPTFIRTGISITDDGDAALSSGTSSTQHTYSSLSSSGPASYVLLTWHDGNSRTLTSATWGGNSCTILFQDVNPTGDAGELGAALLYISGAQSGDLVLNWSNVVFTSNVTVVSLNGVNNPGAPVDTDSEREDSVGSSGVDLDSLSSPGAGGIRLAVFVSNPNSSITWSNAVELSNITASGFYRHTAAYDLGDDGTTIVPSASGDASKKTVVGVSLR